MLRWLVALLAAFAVVALFRWWAALARKALPGGASLVDRVLGVPLGAVLGLLVGTVLLSLALLVPHTGPVTRWAAGARVAHPLLSGAARACGAVERWVPECHGLVRRLHEAERRMTRDTGSTGV